MSLPLVHDADHELTAAIHSRSLQILLMQHPSIPVLARSAPQSPRSAAARAAPARVLWPGAARWLSTPTAAQGRWLSCCTATPPADATGGFGTQCSIRAMGRKQHVGMLGIRPCVEGQVLRLGRPRMRTRMCTRTRTKVTTQICQGCGFSTIAKSQHAPAATLGIATSPPRASRPGWLQQHQARAQHEAPRPGTPAHALAASSGERCGTRLPDPASTADEQESIAARSCSQCPQLIMERAVEGTRSADCSEIRYPSCGSRCDRAVGCCAQTPSTP